MGLPQVLGLAAMPLGTVLLRCIWEFMVNRRGGTRSQCCTGASDDFYERYRCGTPLGTDETGSVAQVRASVRGLRMTYSRLRRMLPMCA